MNNIDIACEVISDLKSKRLSLFCGAGISFNSNLPLVHNLLTYLYETLELDDAAINKMLNSGMPFEKVIETLLVESEIAEIKEIFAKGSPNSNHLLIAKLAKSKMLNIIYTTNFDLLIEKAMKAIGMIEGVDFKVYATEEDLKNVKWQEETVKIIKIHGCASKTDEMAITLGQLASSRYLDLRTDLLSQIFSGKLAKSVLIIGYSCSDFDLVPIIEKLEKKYSNIYFIEHNRTDERTENVSYKDLNNPFKDYRGYRYIGNTDKFIQSLWDFAGPEYFASSSPVIVGKNGWQEHIEKWYTANIGISGSAFKYHISSKLFYAIGELKDTIRLAAIAVEEGRKSKNWKAYAANLDTMGMAYSNSGEQMKALLCYERATTVQCQLNDDHNIASILQSYGNVLHRLQRDNEAIKKFSAALTISKKTKDLQLQSSILGNISNSYIALHQNLTAQNFLTEAINLSRYNGDKQSESSQLGILAHIHMKAGNYKIALKLLSEAMEIKRMIADYNELCKLYLNITTIYFLLENLSEARKTANEGIVLSKKIGNRQLEAQIIYAKMLYGI